MSRNNENSVNDAIDVDAERERSLSAATALALNSVVSRATLDRKRRKIVVELLASGLTIAQAARQVGLSSYQVHAARRSSPEFDEACTIAIELGTDPIVERFQAIALHGNPESMATIRAGEVVLKGRNRAYNDKGGSVRLERRHPDGTVDRITAGANGIPD